MVGKNKILKIHLKQKLQCPSCNEYIDTIYAQTALSDKVFLTRMMFHVYYCPSCKTILNIDRPHG
ncbi:MAG: hypothetical protein ACTSO7_04235 [Candidatus Heimdallarchaeota archaeon]